MHRRAIVALLCLASCHAWTPSQALRASRIGTATASSRRAAVGVVASEHPEELLGPWELECAIAGSSFGNWVELLEEGRCTCSSKVGTGQEWSAQRQPSGAWELHFVLLDKVSRPMMYDGVVHADDVRGTCVSGSVRGPPKRGAAVADRQSGVVVGEFTGYKLE